MPKYPIICVECKKTLAENEEQEEILGYEPFYSDNMHGYLCKECLEKLYYCSACEDFDIELVPCEGELVCSSCKSAYDKIETDKSEYRSLLKRMI